VPKTQANRIIVALLPLPRAGVCRMEARLQEEGGAGPYDPCRPNMRIFLALVST
jgi:hypothetical protein